MMDGNMLERILILGPPSPAGLLGALRLARGVATAPLRMLYLLREGGDLLRRPLAESGASAEVVALNWLPPPTP